MNFSLKLLNTCWRHKLYTSIDELPVYNWVELHKTGSYQHLIKRYSLFAPKHVADTWKKIYNEFYTRFGRTKEFTEYLKKVQKLTLMVCDNGIEFDSARDIHIKALEMELQKFTDKGQTQDFYEGVAVVSKFAGYRINPKTTTVAEYYGMLKIMEKQAKDELNKKQNGRPNKA